MNKRTALRLTLVLSACCLAFLAYCGSAFRPFLVAPRFIVDDDVPRDALPEVRRVHSLFGMGGKPSLDFETYMRTLKTPSRHRVRPVTARMHTERSVLVYDPNRDAGCIVQKLGGSWKRGPSGSGLFVGAHEGD